MYYIDCVRNDKIISYVGCPCMVVYWGGGVLINKQV